jgi:hypothetical protein
MNLNVDITHAVTINSLQKIIDYIEENIIELLTPSVIARHFFFLFRPLTSCSGLYATFLLWNTYETDGLHLPGRSY